MFVSCTFGCLAVLPCRLTDCVQLFWPRVPEYLAAVMWLLIFVHNLHYNGIGSVGLLSLRPIDTYLLRQIDRPADGLTVGSLQRCNQRLINCLLLVLR